MARRANFSEMQHLYQGDGYVPIGDHALQQQFGVSVREWGVGIPTKRSGRRLACPAYRRLRAWLDDPDRQGIYAFMRIHHGTTRFKTEEGEHLRIYASDPDLLFEVRMAFS